MRRNFLSLARRCFGTGLQAEPKPGLPPQTHHPAAVACAGQPLQIGLHGPPPNPAQTYLDFQKICEKKGLVRTANMGNMAGKRSYALFGPLAELEQGLVAYTLDALRAKGFQLISVPDLLYPQVLENCGMATRGERNQVYRVELGTGEEVCLSGTAEMGIGGLLQNSVLDLTQGPLRLAAVSRCFRSEISTAEDERGIFRVHTFTKVEMFGVCRETDSDALQSEFVSIQRDLFCGLELHFRVLEMPVHELGPAAHRKFDMEAWMPGREQWGEISSTSNCTDFQSRRLNIQYRTRPHGDTLAFPHTVNGTACAVPRMLIALVESGQTPRGELGLRGQVLGKYLRAGWANAVRSHPNPRTLFLRKIHQQEAVTSHYNPYVW